MKRLLFLATALLVALTAGAQVAQEVQVTNNLYATQDLHVFQTMYSKAKAQGLDDFTAASYAQGATIYDEYSRVDEALALVRAEMGSTRFDAIMASYGVSLKVRP